jgi:hypothetical protein
VKAEPAENCGQAAVGLLGQPFIPFTAVNCDLLKDACHLIQSYTAVIYSCEKSVGYLNAPSPPSRPSILSNLFILLSPEYRPFLLHHNGYDGYDGYVASSPAPNRTQGTFPLHGQDLSNLSREQIKDVLDRGIEVYTNGITSITRIANDVVVKYGADVGYMRSQRYEICRRAYYDPATKID